LAGRVRKDANGSGYTLKHTIDLRLLNVDPPPRAGDVWPENLQVHWSDRDCRTCVGAVGEITKLGNPPYNTFRGPTWASSFFED
jgi:hypothetical protein